ncbi:MAG: phosphatidylglycerol lysyltransferase domain-containing protein, partial [Candidatus Thermoplasmatota archaeon]
DISGEKPLGFISKESKDWMSKNIPGFSYKEERDLFDYVYRAYDLANLPGSAYSKIRNRLNKFKNQYKYTTESITSENINEVEEFLKRWCIWRDCSSDELLENERKAIIYSMNHFFDLGLSGIILRIYDNIEAISVFERLNNDTVVVHYEKGSYDYDGVYKAVNMETARYLQGMYQFIDRAEDLGIPGLRQAKMSYNPHHFIEVYSVIR